MEVLTGGARLRRRIAHWLSVWLMMVPVMVSGEGADEYDVKAAVLFNFTKFVEWPVSPDSSPFAICILGDDPFGSTIDRLVKGKTAYGRRLRVRRLKDAAEARQCQVVFVRREEESKAAKLIEAVRGLPVLTVGERHKFLAQGGMIRLSMNDGHVGFEVNIWATDYAGLKVSAKLLSLAKTSRDERGEDK